jgi:hypothetical protein
MDEDRIAGSAKDLAGKLEGYQNAFPRIGRFFRCRNSSSAI